MISANGAAGGGGGSGGTVYLIGTSGFKNHASGKILAHGAGAGGKGRVRIDQSKVLLSDGTISPAPSLAPFLTSITSEDTLESLTLDPAKAVAIVDGKSYVIGAIDQTPGVNESLDNQRRKYRKTNYYRPRIDSKTY
jgi:hypothetical protein